MISGKPYIMRAPCRHCESLRGRIETKNGQDCVYCILCGKHQYNAPKTETGRSVRSVQTVHEAIKPKQRMRILNRATGKCEVCGKSGSGSGIHVGHAISVKAGLASGMSDAEINSDENLMALCDECNLGLGAEPMPLRLLIRVCMERLKFLDDNASEATARAGKPGAHPEVSKGPSPVDRVEGVPEEWRDDEAPF